MGYRLEPGQSVANDVCRIAAHQLELAIARLTEAGDAATRDGSGHTARRHIKKVRALIRLVRPALGRRYRSVDRRLRTVNRLLAPIADAQATVAMLERVAWRNGRELPADGVAKLRASVLRRESTAYEDAALDDVFDTVAAVLRAELDRLGEWRVSQTGFGAVARGLERTARASRRAMRKAVASSRVEDYRKWRQRAKYHWLQVRLLKTRCGEGLALDERRLEALDGYLGDCRNCAILREVLTSDSQLDRTDAAHGLRVVRRYERQLRRYARRLGTAIYDETPSDFVTRVGRLWHSIRRPPRTQSRGTPWRSAA